MKTISVVYLLFYKLIIIGDLAITLKATIKLITGIFNSQK